MSDGNEILLPTLDDDESVYNFGLPSLANPSFGASSSSTSLDTYPNVDFIPRNASAENLPRPSISSTPSRPALQKAPASYSTGYSTSGDDRRLGKLSNGSNASLVTPGTSIGSAPGFLSNRKGSLASLKNAFKSNAPAPPVPNLNTAYPALRNPFSRFEPPASPGNYSPRHNTVRKQSAASGRSLGGRSANSQSSLTYRPSEDLVPLPPVPSRSTPSRRQDSDTSAYRNLRLGGSIGGLEDVDEESGLRTAADEALRVIWADFRTIADTKVARVLARPLNTHPSLAAYLETGTDPQFDTLLTSLGQLGKRHARRVFELLSAWCKMHCEGIGASEVRAHLDRSAGMQMRMEDAAAILTGRKSSAAKYVMNRALLELIVATPRDALGGELGMTLEQSVFNAYRSEKLEEAGLPHRQAVSQLQIEVMGLLSSTRFLTVSDRFSRELAKISTSLAKDAEARTEHLLRGVRHLQLKVYPEVELENSSEFVQELATLYANAHGNGLKLAYTETFTHLLQPVIETATAEVNHPLWSKAIALILSRAQAMIVKPRYWSTAFPLVIVALAVSPREVFMSQWQSCMEVVTARIRDRSTRGIALNCLHRMLWVYLNRCTESSTSVRKRLDPILRMVFTTSGGLFAPDIPSQPFSAILQGVMTRQLDYGEEFISEFLQGDPLMQPERTGALVQAIGQVFQDLVEDRPASWPKMSDFARFDDQIDLVGTPLSDDLTARSEIAAFLQQSSSALTNLLISCDRAVGFLLLSNDSVTISSHSSSAAMEGVEQSTRKHGDVFVTFPTRHVPGLRLCATILNIMPRCLDEASFAAVTNVLCRCTLSADSTVADAAGGAIRRCSDTPSQCLALVTTYMQFLFETRHAFRDTFIGVRLLDSQFERVVGLWLDLLQALVGHQRIATAQEEPALGLTPVFIDKIDGCGLFLLCSTNVALRKMGTQVLIAARDLEPQQRLPSAAFRYSRFSPGKQALSRVVQIYDTGIDDAEIKTIRSLAWFTSSDRHRLNLVAAEKGSLLVRVAESDNAKDALLWLAIIPFLIGKVTDQLAQVSQSLRSLVIASVLRLQGHVALIASNTAGRATQGMRSNPSAGRNTADMGALADHWRSYLSILCVTMSIQSSMPATPPVQRTKEVVILTPDTIGSPALFHYLTFLFGWDDPRFKDAAVYATGAIGQSQLRTVSEIMLGVVRRLADGSKMTTRRSTPNSSLWTALAHVFRLISPLLLESRASQLNNLSSIISFVKVTHSLLCERSVKDDYDLQSLRRSFCMVVENLTNALGKLDASDRFLGEEMRGAIFKLCEEWCHVGRRPDVAKARESHTLQAAAEGYRGERDRAQYLDDLQAKTKLLSVAASDAMAGLCQGKLISSDETTPAVQASDHVVEPLTVLRWIRGMFSSSNSAHHETASKALYALIKYNWQCSRLLDEVLHQSFGEGEQFSLESSFFGVIADTLAEGLVQLPIQQTATLCLSKLGHPVADVRQRAFQLCISLVPDDARKAANFDRLYPSVGSQAVNVYRDAQKKIAVSLAQVYGDRALEVLAECTARLSQLEAPRRQATLSILPPWLEHLDLAPDTHSLSPEDAVRELAALSDLMYLSVRFGDDHMDDIRRVLTAFAESSDSGNTHALTRYLFEQASRRKSLDFVVHAQRVMACLAQSSAVEAIFDDIFNLVEPSAMALLPEADDVPSPSTMANLDAVIAPHGTRSQVFSTGQLALLFIGELLPLRLGDAELGKRMLTLLHVALVHCDHPGSALREQCQNVFFQILRSWTCDTSLVRPDDSRSAWSTAQAKLTTLSRSRASIFWKAEDNGVVDSAFLAPTKLSGLIVKVFGILTPLQPRLRQQWGELALLWATSCPIRHLACRSFQVYRVLGPRINARMLSDILARLSSTIASSSPEILSFNLEVLRTFTAIVQKMTSSEASKHPQLFWCTVACLGTPYEEEFTEVIELLSHVLDKFNLSDPAVISQLVTTRPPDWAGPTQVQSLLLVGLRSSKTVMMTFDLIRRLASSPNDELVDLPTNRLLHGFVAALPWMLQSTDLGEPNEELAAMALDLAALADVQDLPSFSRLLTSFAHVRFRAKDDFVRQACSLLRDFCPDHALEIVTLLLGFVLNTRDWMREKAMTMLKLLFQSLESRAPLATHGNELLKPILRLVGTKHAAQALDLLDMPTIPQTSNGGTIFGTVELSGWCIPNAKESSSTTRANVSAVFATCAQETRAASVHYSVVQFKDMEPFENPSQVSLDLPSPPASSIGMTGTDNASIGDLVGALHSLNQFFDDGLEASPESKSNGQYHYKRPSESLSDRRLRVVMARSRHNQSISSPISEKSEEQAPKRNHQHTISDSTVSSVSSDRMSEDATRRPLQVLKGLNVNSRADSRPRYHAQNPSYSSSATDMDDSGDFDRMEANLWGLDDDVANTSFGSIQSHLYGASGGNTPVNGRRGGLFVRSEEGSGMTTPSPRDYEVGS